MSVWPSNHHLPVTDGHAVPAVPSSTSTLPPSSNTLRPNAGQDLKRRKLSPDVYEASSQSYSNPNTNLPPTTALLYHYAVSAHHAAHRHLQQAFVPSSVQCDPNPEYPLMSLHNQGGSEPFVHDPEAGIKALGLQLFALDLLRAGLSVSGLSDRERVAFGLEFGVVGLKVHQALSVKYGGKGKTPDRRPVVDLAKLINDMQDVVAQCHCIAQRHSYLTPMRQRLELLNARLAFGQGKYNVGKRMIQQALALNRQNPAQRYALYLLWLDYLDGSAEFLGVVDDLASEAQANEHQQIVRLTSVIKTRYLFVHRRWELVSSVLGELATAIGWKDTEPSVAHNTWSAYTSIHYLLLRILWEGRVGNDAAAKSYLKTLYALMDETAERGSFASLRVTGGVITMVIPPDGSLLVQLTPPNILYMLTYLTTVVARRDFVGSNASCKNIIHPVTLRATESIARVEDSWDIGFSSMHGLSQVTSLRQQVASIIGEVMLEQATALIFRTCPEEGYQLLLDTVDYLRQHDLFHPLSPHLCLLFAQHAHLLGIDSSTRYYVACDTLIMPGSELGLIAEIGLLGAQGGLRQLLQNVWRQDEVNALAEKCLLSSSATFTAAGQFLASLTDENRVNSKKKLSTAYEISQKSNNSILRGLIFAFTTSTHHYGGRDRMFKQLETGREIAKLLGGKDRDDGVGQVVLGLWCALRLKDFHRQEGDAEAIAEARKSVKAHLDRLTELRQLAATMRGRNKRTG